MTVRQLETQMEARELQEWMAFFAIEPWGAIRADYRSGVVAATLVNVNGGKKGKKPAQASDFFSLYANHTNRRQTNEQQISIMQKIAAVQNG